VVETLTESGLRELARSLEGLSKETRGALSGEWARAAQFEHASIASFSRFSLELLAVGAPPELIEGAHRAALDEVAHARLSFALASVYAGSPLGPGPLALGRDVLASFELIPIVTSALAEGCVNETLAALEAHAGAADAEPSAVREVLTVIARDESEHAALSFRFVRWALERGDRDVRSAAGERSHRGLSREGRTRARGSARFAVFAPRARRRREAARGAARSAPRGARAGARGFAGQVMRYAPPIAVT
jgi:hypothetical protein